MGALLITVVLLSEDFCLYSSVGWISPFTARYDAFLSMWFILWYGI